MTGADHNLCAIFIYDGDCTLCAAAVHWLQHRGTGQRLAFAPYQSHPPAMSLAGLTRQDCEAAAYVVLQNNQDIHVYRGAAAVNFALSTLHGRSRVGWRALSGLYRVPILHRLEDMVYSVIARNRHRIGLSGPACNIP